MGTRRYEETVTTTAPPAVVWRIWTEVTSWPEWTPSVTSVEPHDDALPLHEGSTVRVHQPRLPAADWTVTELVPDREFTWTGTAPGVVTVARHLVEPDGTGSRITARLEQSGPMAGLVGVLMGRLVRSYLRAETAGLRTRAEG